MWLGQVLRTAKSVEVAPIGCAKKVGRTGGAEKEDFQGQPTTPVEKAFE